MPLSSFLLKPMQRITRYPLHIKNVSTPTVACCMPCSEPKRLCFKMVKLGVFLGSSPDSREYSWASCGSRSVTRGFGEGWGAVLSGQWRRKRKRELGPTWVDPKPCPMWRNHRGEQQDWIKIFFSLSLTVMCSQNLTEFPPTVYF